jgi:hypothetical protein
LTAALAQRVWKNGANSPAEDNTTLAALRKNITSVLLVPCVKALAGIRENDPEWNTVLPPLTKLNAKQMGEAQKTANSLGF